MFPPGMTETRSPPYTMRGRAASARASGLLVAVLTLVALALRATQLNQSLFGDELFTYDLVHGHGLLGVIRDVRTGVEDNPPLFYVLAWPCGRAAPRR